MNRLLVKLATDATGSLLFSSPIGAQIPPPAPRVEIIKGPALEIRRLYRLHRTIGVTYKTAWFMAHRIRESMREIKPGPLGGEGKFVEADETFTGGQAKNRAYKAPLPKEAVMSLVERGGKVRTSTSRK